MFLITLTCPIKSSRFVNRGEYSRKGCGLLFKKILKALPYFVTTLIIGCIGFLLFVTIQAHKHPNQIPSFFGYKPLTVLTNSMEPKISAGDMVFVKEKPISSIKKGDIITFKQSEKKLITHRVFRVDNEGFQTKGDNNNVKDNWVVHPENVIGEVKTIIPNAGYVAKFLTSKAGFFLFILLPLLLFVLIEVYTRVLRYLDRKEKGEEWTKA